jgi:hypothetical protein
MGKCAWGIPSLDRIDVFAGGAAIGNQTPITDFFLSPTALAPDPLLSGQPSSVPEPACVVPLAVAIGVLLLRRSSESSHA